MQNTSIESFYAPHQVQRLAALGQFQRKDE